MHALAPQDAITESTDTRQGQREIDGQTYFDYEIYSPVSPSCFLGTPRSGLPQDHGRYSAGVHATARIRCNAVPCCIFLLGDGCASHIGVLISQTAHDSVPWAGQQLPGHDHSADREGETVKLLHLQKASSIWAVMREAAGVGKPRSLRLSCEQPLPLRRCLRCL